MASSRCGARSRSSSGGWSRRSGGRCRLAEPTASGPGSPGPGSRRPSPPSSPGPARPILVPPGGEAAFLAPHPSGLLTPDPDVRARLDAVRPAPDRGRRRARPVRAGRPVRRGGRPDPRPGPRRGARAVPAAPTPRSGSRSACPIEPAVEDLEPLRFVLHRLAAALTGQLVARGLAASRARLHLDLDLAFARAGTPAELDVEQRFPEPTADAEAIERLLFARLERTPPPAAVARLVAGAGRHGPGGRSAAPAVHAAGRPRRPARVAAGPARPDVRGGSGPAGGPHRPGGAAARDALGVAAGRLERRGVPR